MGGSESCLKEKIRNFEERVLFSGDRESSLQRKVTSLEKEVSSLKKKVSFLEKEVSFFKKEVVSSILKEEIKRVVIVFDQKTRR